MYPPFGRDYTIAVKNAIRRTDTVVRPIAAATKGRTTKRWLGEASRPASPAFRTVRETRRLTRLLSLLPLVTGTQRQGRCCAR